MTLRKTAPASVKLPAPAPKFSYRQWRSLWFERVMAIATVLNLGIVFFDLSFVPWHNFYQSQLPTFTAWYGSQFKGIEPHHATERYLQTVTALEEQVVRTGLRSPEVALLLGQLQNQSAELVDENPFQGAGKSGTLERIKRRMRDRVNQESSKQAFDIFWSPDYLSQQGWNRSLQFFNRQIRPLIATNYFRGIDDNGDPIDRFWRIDVGFIALFGAELIARCFYLSRRYKGITWIDALVWRWYDLLLLLPFWRWLRLIPVLVRLNQAKLVNLAPLSDRLMKGLITSIAIELTEVVVLRVIDQIQDFIRQGDITRWVLQSGGGRPYIDLNNINETEAIANHLVTLLAYQVLPQIKPEIEALMHHSLTRILSSSPVYTGFQRLPGFGGWSNQLTQQMVTEVSQNTYQALIASLEDPEGRQHLQTLITRFGTALQTEAQRSTALEEIQSLAIALLEEIKINYVKRLATADPEALRAETKRLYNLTR
ncbi:MAG: hypothetical protein MUF49_12705 [Oculatellaceae cyanobacterium Prado106]|jgi:hypothetical protein|nr:hypothetical protein [Oculatellaceae cyanobacterium Prado106]